MFDEHMLFFVPSRIGISYKGTKERAMQLHPPSLHIFTDQKPYFSLFFIVQYP